MKKIPNIFDKCKWIKGKAFYFNENKIKEINNIINKWIRRELLEINI